MTCFLCRDDVRESDPYVLWVLHDGRLVEVCSNCLDRADRDEPFCSTLDYTETYTDA